MPPRVAMPVWTVAIGRGLAGRCPACGNAALFRSYLSVVPCCAACNAALGDVPADDAPPYLTIFFAAHPVVLLALVLTRDTALGTGEVLLISLPLAVLLALGLLRPIKGGLIAVLLKLDIWRDGPEALDSDRSVERGSGPGADLTERPRMPLTSVVRTTRRSGAPRP